MADGVAIVGRACKLYLNGGTHAAAVLALMKSVSGVKLARPKGEVSLKDRMSPNEKFLAGYRSSNLQFSYTYRVGVADAVYAALLDSYTADTPIELYVLRGLSSVSGVSGWRAYYQAFKMDESQEEEGVVKFDVELKLTEYAENDVIIEPDEYEVP